MRKIIHRYTVLLLTVLLVGTGIALADTDVVVLGDVNSDGSVTTADVTALVNYLHGSGTVNLTAADANKDGAVDIADVTAINNIITSGTSDKGTTSTLFFPATTVEKTYGDVAFTNPIVRSGSKGAITYESSVPGVATVNTTTGEVTIMGAGTATITATLADNGGITGTTANYTLNVGQAAASITTSPASVAGDLTYDGTAQNLVTAGDASGGTLKYFVNTSGEVPTTETDGWTDVVSTGTDADTYYVWYYVAGDANHTNTAVTAIEGNTKAISKFNLTNAAIATEIGDQQYAGAQVTPAAPAIKLGESTIDASNYDVSYGENNSVGTGTVIYTAKAGSANFSGAKIVDFTITSGTLSVTAEDYSGTYDGAAHGITVTCDGATIKYRTTAEGEYDLTENPTYTNAGTVQTVYYQVTKDNYLPVTGSATVTISQKEVTVSGITAENKTYDGTTDATLVYTGVTIAGKVGSDDLTVTATGAFADADVGTGKTVTISGITLGGASAANYKLAASDNQESTTADITAASFTPVVTLSGWTYGSPNDPSVGDTNTSGGAVTYYYKTGDAEWTTTQPTDAGTHQVKASIAANGNYAAAESAEVEFTITQATNSFNTQPTITGWTYGADANAPTGAVVQFGTPTYKYCATEDGEYGTYESVVNDQAGTWYVKGFVEGTTNYAAATSDAVSFTISKADITPSVTMSGWTYGEEASSPSVTGNTGNGGVTYQYKVSGADDNTYSEAVPTTPGTYTVKATVAETTNYNGNSATAEFTIASGTLTVTAEDYSGAYDGVAHGITVTCEGATIKYGETEETYDLDVSPTLTNVGTKTVYYQVTKDNYTTVTGSQTVTITAVAATVTTAPAAVSGDLTYTGEALTLFTVGSDVTGGTLKYKVTTSSTKPENTDGFKTTIDQQTNAGTYYLWYYVDGDVNHNSTEINATGVSKVISKASATLTCSTTALSFAASDKANATVTKTEVSCSGGTINVRSSNGNYCTVSYSSGTITVKRVSEAAWSATITVSVTPDGNHTAPSNVQFTVSGAYDSGIAASSVTSSHIGYVLAANGKIYKNVAAATSANTTAVAMIAYVGNASNCSHGLAIALEDVSSNYLTWDNSGSNNGGKTAAEFVTNWGSSHSVSGGTCRLPSVDDWKYMFRGCGGATYSSSTTAGSDYSYGRFREKLKALNTSYDVQSGYYWSSTENSSDASTAWSYGFIYSLFYNYNKTTSKYVRACYAF